MNPSDYPSFIQPNPLGHPLTDRGMALSRLRVTEAQITGIPSITPRVIEAVGSVREAIEILSGDDAPDSLAFCNIWRSLSAKDKSSLHLEDIITAAGLTTRRFMEILAGAAFEHSATVGKIFTATSQLKVLKSTVKAATDEVPITAYNPESGENEVVGKSNGDVKAMEIFHKITGALPTPKGSNFTFNQQITKGSDIPSPERQPLQTMDSWLLEIDDIRKPRQLNAPSEPMIPVEMPSNAPEIEYLPVSED